MKTPRQLERYFKGAANHRRIAILLAVKRREGMALEDITIELKSNPKTISQHTRVLVHAGLLNKKYIGRQVAHNLSPYGQRFTSFIKSF